MAKLRAKVSLSEKVLIEIQRRAARKRSLASGANRGDWLYAGAVRFYGSWGNAVEAAGYCYGDAKRAALTRDDVLRRIRRASDAGEPLRLDQHPVVVPSARRHFGTWKAAVEAAGCQLPTRYKWPADRVLAQLRDDRRRGLSLGSLAVIARNEPLYGAARRRFGSWAAAVAASMAGADAPLRASQRGGQQKARRSARNRAAEIA